MHPQAAHTESSVLLPQLSPGIFALEGNMQIRELTKKEKLAIRYMVKSMCANYDTEYGCLPLDGECFMFGKLYNNNILCKWFRNAILPLNPKLERVFTGKIAPDIKPCSYCGRQFPINRRQSYCSDKCAKLSRQKSITKNVRAYRERKRQCNQLASINTHTIVAQDFLKGGGMS